MDPWAPKSIPNVKSCLSVNFPVCSDVKRQTCLHEERTMLTWETKWLRGAPATAESIGGDEVREPRRRNSPSDPTSREIEDHVLTGRKKKNASFRSWCAACVQGRGRAERHQGEEAARSLKMARRSQSCRGIIVSLEPGIESVKLRWNSVETVLSW